MARLCPWVDVYPFCGIWRFLRAKDGTSCSPLGVLSDRLFFAESFKKAVHQ